MGKRVSHEDFLALLAGQAQALAPVLAGEEVEIATPFQYPARGGPVTLYLQLAPGPQGGPAPSVPIVRISDGGKLLKSLAQQGMEVEIDMILSRTVFHAVGQVEGASIKGGQVYLDATADAVPAAIWKFLQLVAEITGLRHSKYKDALIQFERRERAEAEARGKRPPR